jgi:hypothetical protein
MAKGQNAEQNGSEEQPQGATESAQTTSAPATTGTAVAEVKRTPAVIAQTNIQKAEQLRQEHAAELERIGPNMSEKIRYLHDQHLSKGDISRVLQIQFQFVRNVVFNYEQKLAKQAAEAEAAKAKTPAQS